MSKEISSTQIQNWSDKITDRGNLWLAATNLEDDGNFLEAAKLYLKDAAWCAIKAQLVRAALSASCAARCLESLGHPQIAQALYSQAGSLYESNAYSILDKSIREALWSFQRAYETLILARSKEKAQEMLYKYTSLASKVSPFSDVQHSMRMLGFKEIQDNDTGHSDLRSSGDVSKFDDQQVNTRELAPDLALSVNNFLEASGSVFRLRTFNDEKEDGDSQSLNDDNSSTDKDSTKTSE
jgi:hypothetical protein